MAGLGWWLGPCAAGGGLSLLGGVVPLLLRRGLLLPSPALCAWDESDLIGVNLVLGALVAGVFVLPAVLLQGAEHDHRALAVLGVVLEEVLALFAPESHVDEGGFAVFPLLCLLIVLAGVVGEGELHDAFAVWRESLLRLPGEVAANRDVVGHLQFHFFELSFVEVGAHVDFGAA